MLQGDGLAEQLAQHRLGRPHYVQATSARSQRLDRPHPAHDPHRASRAIAGYSMGGFGAMNVALTQLRNYSVVESWEGFSTTSPRSSPPTAALLHSLPLHAFV